MAAAAPVIAAIGTMAGGAAAVQSSMKDGPSNLISPSAGPTPQFPGSGGDFGQPQRLPSLSASMQIPSAPQLGAPQAPSAGGGSDLSALLAQLSKGGGY